VVRPGGPNMKPRCTTSRPAQPASYKHLWNLRFLESECQMPCGILKRIYTGCISNFYGKISEYFEIISRFVKVYAIFFQVHFLNNLMFDAIFHLQLAVSRAFPAGREPHSAIVRLPFCLVYIPGIDPDQIPGVPGKVVSSLF
jgi:hypothetical protein